ncbi:nxpe family member 2 [Plakobranchus ocellatus]|uniref:Nxpe family member 2 n=1 Tax=Plakobranchus ocellatus TaxID=259542 RepID=A0AAV4D501_9GAST|nr:nxpe family member 2 [Plakobranchus ocellatus]
MLRGRNFRKRTFLALISSALLCFVFLFSRYNPLQTSSARLIVLAQHPSTNNTTEANSTREEEGDHNGMVNIDLRDLELTTPKTEAVETSKRTETETLHDKNASKSREGSEGAGNDTIEKERSGEQKRRDSGRVEEKEDSDRIMRQISIEEAVSVFQHKAAKECVNKCPQVDENEGQGEYISSSVLCRLTQQNKWTRALQSVKIEVTPFLTNDVYVYPYELEYLSYSKARTADDLPNAKNSLLTFPGAVASGNVSIVSCKLGETLTGRLDLIDGRGKQRIGGGDEVRAWMGAIKSFEGETINSMYPRSMVPVTDLKNGSYKLEVPCLWAGRSHLILNIRYPREFLRMAVETVRRGLSRFLGARFESGGAVEEVPCLPTPNIPGRPCICNLTTANGGSPFYCARPLDRRLSCEDWTISGTLTRVSPSEMAKAEGDFVMKSAETQVQTDHLVFVSNPDYEQEEQITKNSKNSFKNNTDDEIYQPQLFIPSPKKPCIEMSPKVTWKTKRPTGYWRDEDKTWVSLLCREPPLTTPWMRACLKNSHVWVIGDSNGIRLYYKVADAAGLERLDYGPMPFFDVLSESAAKENINIHYSPHEHPLYVTKIWKNLDVAFIGVPQKIDAIPSKGRQFLLLHYYLHLTYVHLGAARLRLLAARDAIARLLARNPEAVVGIRGPHTVAMNANYDIAYGGDTLARFLLEMILEDFAGLQDRVLFLDGWEGSLTLQSEGIHAAGPSVAEIARKFFSFVCDEKMGRETEKL